MRQAQGKWLIMLALASPLAARAVEQMSVQVQNAQLRADASYLARPVGNAPYGTQVTILQERGDWRQVQPPGGPGGWVHLSALSAKRIAMKAGAQDVGTAASGEELALAGKGFNSDVEADFKNKNRQIDFTWIDRMEKIKVPVETITKFLSEGQVKPPQG